MDKKTEKLRDEANKHAEQALRLFDQAEELQRTADTVSAVHEQHEAMQKIHTKDKEALSELQKSAELGNELIRKQREELKQQLREINKRRRRE